MRQHFETNGLTCVELAAVSPIALSDDPWPAQFDRMDGRNGQDDSLDAAAETFRRVFQWIYQPPAVDHDGLFVRSLIACWVFNPTLRGLSMADMSRRHGKKKQSLGRWVVDFKQEFPELTDHLLHLRHEHPTTARRSR